MTHNLKRKRTHYFGASSLLTLPPMEFEAALAAQALEVQQESRVSQDKFDRARKSYFEQIERFGEQSQQAEAMRQVWRRLEAFFAELQADHVAHVQVLRRENAKNRVKLREAERRIDALTKESNPQ